MSLALPNQALQTVRTSVEAAGSSALNRPMVA